VLGLSTFLLTACAGGDGGGGSEPGGVTNQLGYESGVAPREQGLTTLEALGLYVLAPLTIPGVAKGARYRPARGWNAAPLWFGGPPDPAAAVESADPAGIVRGGASGNW
jgi:hypothetical protein